MGVFKEYFGELEEESIRDNLLLYMNYLMKLWILVILRLRKQKSCVNL